MTDNERGELFKKPPKPVSNHIRPIPATASARRFSAPTD